MRILLTNDDGINAAGMAAMECVAAELSDDVWTVAPETDQSGIAHALTFSHPLRVRELGQRRFAVNGTPADCVIVGATRVLPERPDIVLSGINLGQNIADDVFYSGTIGGAMEACFMGIRGIALSQAYRMVDGERYAPWETSQAHCPTSCGACSTPNGRTACSSTSTCRRSRPTRFAERSPAIRGGSITRSARRSAATGGGYLITGSASRAASRASSRAPIFPHSRKAMSPSRRWRPT